MTICLGIDLETSGICPKTSEILEVGLVLYHAESKTVIEVASYLVKNTKPVPKEIYDLTGISETLLLDHAQLSQDDVPDLINMWASKANWIVAHNASFEQSFIQTDLPWIDTKTDLPYPPFKGDGTLSNILMSHGIMNTRPHRALPDTQAMMDLLSRYDFQEVLTLAKSPSISLEIKFPYDATGVKNSQVKALGYYWQLDFKSWKRECKEIHLEENIKKAEAQGFSVKRA